MNTVTISHEDVEPPSWQPVPFILAVLEKLEKHSWDLSVLFCGKEKIQRLNEQYRNKNEPTDVLSFVMGEYEGDRFIPGDIVISPEAAEENARAFGVSPNEELRRLLVHGILHLSGMDHTTNDKEEPMLVFQEKLLEETRGMSFNCNKENWQC